MRTFICLKIEKSSTETEKQFVICICPFIWCKYIIRPFEKYKSIYFRGLTVFLLSSQ